MCSFTSIPSAFLPNQTREQGSNFRIKRECTFYEVSNELLANNSAHLLPLINWKQGGILCSTFKI